MFITQRYRLIQPGYFHFAFEPVEPQPDHTGLLSKYHGPVLIVSCACNSIALSSRRNRREASYGSNGGPDFAPEIPRRQNNVTRLNAKSYKAWWFQQKVPHRKHFLRNRLAVTRPNLLASFRRLRSAARDCPGRGAAASYHFAL